MPEPTPADLCRQIAELLPEGTEVPGWAYDSDTFPPVWYGSDSEGFYYFESAKPIDLAAFTYAAEGVLLRDGWTFEYWGRVDHCWHKTTITDGRGTIRCRNKSRPLAALASLRAMKEKP